MFEPYQSSIPVPAPSPTPAQAAQITIAINASADIVIARQHGRQLSLESGCSSAEATLVATIISELARNIVQYAKPGAISLEKTRKAHSKGIKIVCRDSGPGIADVHRALGGGYSTSGGLGMGLSGVRRLVDEFDLDTGRSGTTVTVTKWLC